MLHFIYMCLYAIAAHEIGHALVTIQVGERIRWINLFCQPDLPGVGWFTRAHIAFGPYRIGMNPLIGGSCQHSVSSNVSNTKHACIDAAGIAVNTMLVALGWWQDDWTMIAVNLAVIALASSDVREATDNLLPKGSLLASGLLWIRPFLLLPVMTVAWSNGWTWFFGWTTVGFLYVFASMVGFRIGESSAELTKVIAESEGTIDDI